MIVLALGLLCSLECTVLAVDDGAGLHTADAPAPAEDNLLKLSESAEVHKGGHRTVRQTWKGIPLRH